jgi:tryptophan synthase alpha chain
LEIIGALVEGGADALELGIPFSDPIADGPTIQAATVRALQSGVTPDHCFEILKQVRAQYPEMPIGLLVYANLLAVNGASVFYKRVAEAGVDSVLVADLPIYEAEPFIRSASQHGVQAVFIAPPNADEERLRSIAERTQGYTYVVARAGVTGVDKNLDLKHKNIFDRLRRYGAPPALIGFGISRPEHVRTVLGAGAAGAISGSAVVNIVQKNANDPPALIREISSFVRTMKSATNLDSQLK